MAFRVGQKVVCVNAGDIDGVPQANGFWDEGEEIVEGQVYTIHSTFLHACGERLVRLVEVRRTPFSISCHGHDGYAAERFRPVVDRKTDISFAHEILRKASRKQEADA
jgi:hypothetical protein